MKTNVYVGTAIILTAALSGYIHATYGLNGWTGLSVALPVIAYELVSRLVGED